jgi:hypothetical protein
MPLTEQEQAQALRFLGYTNWRDLASSFQLGYPAPSQPEYLIRDAFVRLDEQGIELVRKDLCELNSIERQMSESRGRLRAAKVGDMQLNHSEFNQLRQHLIFWQGRLADDLGGYPNPFASAATTTAGGRNAQVC